MAGLFVYKQLKFDSKGITRKVRMARMEQIQMVSTYQQTRPSYGTWLNEIEQAFALLGGEDAKKLATDPCWRHGILKPAFTQVIRSVTL